jgi:TetR/AcrR family transcriptional regulator
MASKRRIPKGTPPVNKTSDDARRNGKSRGSAERGRKEAVVTQPRRMGVEGSKMRALFLDAAEAILRDEGYAGISARQVSTRAGLKPQLLYYYFQTMDDLILAVIRRINERRLGRFEGALTSSDPLTALWKMNSDPSFATLSAEMTAIAAHRETIRTEVVRSAEAFRVLQVQEISRLLAHRNKAEYPAAGIVMIASALARIIVQEASLGITYGHDEAVKIVETVLRDLSGSGPISPHHRVGSSRG